MSPTRRRFLLAGTGAVTALAGCSTRSNAQQPLLVAVNNYTGSRHRGYVLVEQDGTEVVHQYAEVAAARPDTWETVETKVTLGERASDAPLDVTASFGDDLEATDRHTLDCSDESSGDAIYVQIEPENNGPNLRLNLLCYSEFPSSEAAQGGLGFNQS